jgi:rubrerythrin
MFRRMYGNRDCLNCSPAIECTSLSPSAAIWQDVLAQAMTGELIAAMNYTSLAEICDDPEEVADALEHAEGERGHAAAFAAEGRKIGVDVPNNVDGKALEAAPRGIPALHRRA